MEREKHYKVGYVAIAGCPNVGKSTLMNKLLGQKLSIVTAKPQTTRHKILGILSGDDFQIIFLDTPGLIKPKYKLQEVMMRTAANAVRDADVLVFMIEATTTPGQEESQFLTELDANTKPTVLVINKIDLVDKDQLLPLIDRCRQLFNFAEIIPISALHADGLDRLQMAIVSLLPEGLPFYPSDMVTEHPERFFVSEIIREKIFERYGEEIPYSTTVHIEEFKERPERKDYIRAAIFVERNSQKGILIGKQGSALKQVGTFAREEIELFLGRPVYLELRVGVKEQWRQKEQVLRELGYG